MGPIQVVVEDGNNLVLEVTPTPDTTVILDRGIAGPPGPMGEGDVDGPASSTDNAVARFDGTTGKVIQNSNVTIDDSGNLTYSAGTANGVAYLNGSKVLTTGSALTFNGTNLGIGNSSPSRKLEVTGSGDVYALVETTGTTGTVGLLFGDSASDSVGRIEYVHNSDVMQFTTGGSEQMRLTSTGLGIGTSSPGTKLDVAGGIQANSVKVGTTQDIITSGMWYQSSSAQLKWSSPAGGFGWNNNANSVELMVLTDSGNLGIGTSSPSGKLHVVGPGSSDNAATNPTLFVQAVGNTLNAIKFNGASTTDLYFGRPASVDAFAWGTVVGGERMRLDPAGNLGLGVTPSAWGSGFKAIQMTAGASFGSHPSVPLAYVNANSYFDGSNNRYIQNSFASRFLSDGNSGGFSWQVAPSGTAGDAISFTQAMTLDASGNLGVGTTSPASVLDVVATGVAVATVRTTSTTGAREAKLRLNVPSTGGDDPAGQIEFTFGTGYTVAGSIQMTHTSPNMKFFTGTTERARIDGNGNLLVGKTSSSANGDGAQLFPSGTVGLGHTSGTVTGTAYAAFGYAGGGIGSITQDGTTGVLYNTTSDQRLKENIQDAAPASALIDALQVREYNWKSDGSRQRYGFIAQELVTVAPEAVHQPADPEEMMAVDYSKLVPMLVKEIQSLRARVAALESI